MEEELAKLGGKLLEFHKVRQKESTYININIEYLRMIP